MTELELKPAAAAESSASATEEQTPKAAAAAAQPFSDILRPTLHDNDFLQSFVRIGLDETTPEPQRHTTFADERHPRSKDSHTGPSSSSNKPSQQQQQQQQQSGDHNQRRLSRSRERGSLARIFSERRSVQEILQDDLKAHKSKKRRRRKSDVHRQEEVYTDKDRAAAVNMGSRDIKQSLKIKRKQDRSKNLQIPEEAEPSAMLALGMRELRCGNVTVALSCINKALELSPTDKNALIARSKCHLLLGEPQKALEDAEATLTGRMKDPHYAKALFSKAEALYHLGDFELSLVFYYKGMKIRPEFDQFRLGVQKAKEAIQNILGSNAIPTRKKSSSRTESRSHCSDDTLEGGSIRPKTSSPMTVVGSEKVDSNNQSVDRPKEVRTISSKNASFSSRQKRTKAPKRPNNQDQHLLSQLNVDKKYLQEFVKRPDVKAAHQESAQHIIVHAEEGINFLKSRQEFWRQQRATSQSKSRKK